MSQTILHVDMDAFFPSIEQFLNPKLRGKPVIVGAKPWERGVVSSASYEARKYGVHSAMPSSEAGRLCPKGVFVHGHYDLYGKFSKKIQKVLFSFTPSVEMFSLDEAFLDFTGFDLIYKNTRKLALEIQRKILNEVGLSCSVGAATSKTVSKIASDFKKPNGVTIVESGSEKEFLAPLPIRSMPGIGPKFEEKLDSFHIYKLKDIQTKPASFFSENFGKCGLDIYKKSFGFDNSKVEAFYKAKSASRETTFSQDVNDFDVIVSTLSILTDEVVSDIRSKRAKAKTVELKLRYSDFSTLTRSKSLIMHTDLQKEIWEVVKSLLDFHLNKNRYIRLVGVGLSNFEDTRNQQTIFSKIQEKVSVKLDRLNKQGIDKVRTKFGFASIKSGQSLKSKIDS